MKYCEGVKKKDSPSKLYPILTERVKIKKKYLNHLNIIVFLDPNYCPSLVTSTRLSWSEPKVIFKGAQGYPR